MASSKDTFEANTFAANTFAGGTWRGTGASNALVGQWSNVHKLSAPGRIDIGIQQGRFELKAPGRIDVRG